MEAPSSRVIARQWACPSSCPLPETWPPAPRAQIRPGSTLTPRAAGENATYTAGGGGYLDGQLETETQVFLRADGTVMTSTASL